MKFWCLFITIFDLLITIIKIPTQTPALSSAYRLYGKPRNSRENSNGTVHPCGNFPEKSNTFRGVTFFSFLPKRLKFSVPFVWITSARLHVERKRKIYWYFVNGTTQSRSCFSVLKKIPVYHFTENFQWNFRTNDKRSLWHSCYATILTHELEVPVT